MRAADVSKLRPFTNAVDSYSAAVTDARRGGCTCRTAGDGLYRLSAACHNRPARRCYTTTLAGVRAHLASLRLPVDHLDDRQLLAAVEELGAIVLDLPTLTPRQFHDRVKSALGDDGATATHAQEAFL